jgi:uncharacterized protein
MLIDINANTGHWPFQQMQCTSCNEMLARMDRYGVDLSVVSNLNGIFYKNVQAANEELHEELMSDKRFKDRFLPFAIINPQYAGWKNDLDICVNEMGVRGIRLYPVYHDYELSDPCCIDLVKVARDMGLIVGFTFRMFDPRGPRHWMDTTIQWSLGDLIPVIQEVPDATYFFLNVVGNIFALSEAERNLLIKTNVLIDTSGASLGHMGNAIATYGADKFAFGTHSPILDYLTGLLRIESLREDEVTEASRDLLRSGNARKILRI